MSLLEPTQKVLYKDLPSAKDTQFLMRKLSVHNWGTFKSIHTCRFAENGVLMLGASGAGKSTLLDAMSAMIVPPSKVHFNAAAEEGEKRGRDRSLYSYIRGAWGDKSNKETREVVKQYLRPGATMSAIALEYGDRLGRTLTLVRMFWLTGTTIPSKIPQHFMVVEGKFDMSLLKGFDFDIRKLKKKLDQVEGLRHHENFTAYQEHWSRVMGINDEKVLELLHKTQSTKSLGDLNQFLRQFMLAEPETFAKADALVAEFGELDEAHKAVVTARRQIDVLRPAHENFLQLGQLIEDRERKDVLRKAISAFVQHVRVGLIEDELRRLETAIEADSGQLAVNGPRLYALAERIQTLKGLHLQAGGADIQTKERRLGELHLQREARNKALGRVDQYCKALGWTLADNPQDFAEQIGQAKAMSDAYTSGEQSYLATRDKLNIEFYNLDKEMKDLREDIRALEETSSNIPKDLLRIRADLCAALQIPLSQVAFVGELIQVRDEYASEWAPAIEKLLGGFGKDLLVEETRRKEVNGWVNRTDTGLRLFHNGVQKGVSNANRHPKTANSVVQKLDLKRDHPYSGWVYKELVERFDFECVDSPSKLVDHSLTAQGQIRHGKGRTEKDDRYDIRNKRHWVLGFDSREKLEDLREQGRECGAEIARVQLEQRTLESERQQDHLRKEAAGRLLDFEFENIDVASIATLIGEMEDDIKRLKAGNTTLSDLDGQIVQANLEHQRILTQNAELENRASTNRDWLKTWEHPLQTAKVEAGGLPADHRQALATRMPENWKPTLDSLQLDVQRVAENIRDEMESLTDAIADTRGQIIWAFNEFLREWAVESGSLQANIESAPDFFAKLDRLVQDGLPEHEAKFRNLLNQQSTNRLVELGSHVNNGRKEIKVRLEDVNDALFAVNYNPGSYLKIEPIDLPLPELVEFRERLNEITEGRRQQEVEPEVAEERFQLLRNLVMRLKAEDPKDKQWREKVLDIRLHVEFGAHELERGTDYELFYHGGSDGKSGGQRQKLTATCLAAALRYQLGGTDGDVPTYAPVVLDEAFTKTDDAFTATCMEIFTTLGFQMIVATPIKSVNTLEQYVGGAVFVKIRDLNVSAVKQIDYVEDTNKLNLSEEDRREAMGDDADD